MASKLTIPARRPSGPKPTNAETGILQQRTETLLAGYLLLSAGLILRYSANLQNWGVYVLAHFVAAGLILSLRRLPPRLPAGWQLLRDWFPVLLMPLFYKEVEVLAAAFGNWGLTAWIRQLETTLFSGHPSLYLSARLPSVTLSEALHFCYLSFVLLLPGIGGYWYARGRQDAFRELLFLYWVGYSLSLLFFTLFPVDSPFYLEEPLGPPFAGHFFYDLVHFVSGRGGARGAAFPSAHVSGAVVVWAVAWCRDKRLALLLSPIIAGLILATVYARFHYALDTIAGFALGTSIAVGYRLVQRRQERRGSEA